MMQNRKGNDDKSKQKHVAPGMARPLIVCFFVTGFFFHVDAIPRGSSSVYQLISMPWAIAYCRACSTHSRYSLASSASSSSS